MLILITILYFIFIIWLINGFNHISNNSFDEKSLSVSVIVSVKNEETNIQNLLNSISHQDYPIDCFEIIIANDKSTDNTLGVLEKNKESIKNLKIININETPDDWSSKKWALNQAIQESKGDIILQTDGDCVPDVNWIKKMIAPFSKGDIGFVLGYAPLEKKYKNFIDKILIFENLAQDAFFASCAGNGLTMSCVGRNIAFRKKYFLDVNGYEDMKNIKSGDDDLLLHRIIHSKKCKVAYVITKYSNVYSRPPENVKEFTNQRLRFASKGELYYRLFYISNELKIILPFLLLINIIAIISLVSFFLNPEMILLFPWFIKTCAELIFLRVFCNIFNLNFDYYSFFILSLLHPFYILVFSLIGPFKKYSWK